MMSQMSKLLVKSEYTDFEDNDYSILFKQLDMLCTGKASVLKSILMYVMTIQLYEVGSTDLDEVAEALRDAVDGLQLYSAASTTIHSLKPALLDYNKDFLADCVNSQRFIAFSLNKVACRLVHGNDESSEANEELSKISILKNGIAEKFIPRLSEECKKEIEGSFKITNNTELRDSCKAEAETVILSETD